MAASQCFGFRSLRACCWIETLVTTFPHWAGIGCPRKNCFIAIRLSRQAGAVSAG